MLKVVNDAAVSSDTAVADGSVLDELVRDGARQMLAAALLAEVAAYVDAHAGQVDADGHRLVVRNGSHVEREVTTAAGAVMVKALRVNDKRIDELTGERCRFCSAILPVWVRKSPRIAEVLPLLYLHGLSSSDFTPAWSSSWAPARVCSGAWLLGSASSGRTSSAPSHPLPGGLRLRLHVGRRDPPEGPARAGQGLSAGDDRRPVRRPEGTHLARGRAAGIERVLGGSAALV